MTQNRLIALAVIILVAAGVAITAAALLGGKAEAPEPAATATSVATAPATRPAATASPVAPTTPTPNANICGTNPSPPAANLKPADFGYRLISAPAAGASVRSPLHMTGDANPFEGAYGITIVGAGASQIATKNFNKDNQVLAFTADLPFSVTAATPACVWYHERSGRDGSPVGITQIPVTLLP